MHRVVTAAFVGLLLLGPSASSAATITFDDLGLTSVVDVYLAPVDVGSGFTMQRSSVESGTVGRIIHVDPTSGFNSSNAGGNLGYRYLTAHNAGQPLTNTLRRADGAAFDLLSLDYHGWNNNMAHTLVVEGLTSTGGLVSQSFAITNTFTSPFHHAVLSAGFRDLVSVTFTAPTPELGVFQIDNLEVGPSVPEPTCLGALSLLALAWTGRRRLGRSAG